MSSRRPYAAVRSKSRAELASAKWKCEPTWTGLSPVLVTTTSIASRPEFSVTGSDLRTYSPGIMGVLLSDGIVNRDELGAVRERGLDLDVVDHLGHPFHDVVAGEQRGSVAHQVRHCPAVACPFNQFVA